MNVKLNYRERLPRGLRAAHDAFKTNNASAARSADRESSTARIKRAPAVNGEPSCIVKHKRPSNYWRLFCAHDRPMWAVCSASTCRRNAAEAAANFVRLVEGELC